VGDVRFSYLGEQTMRILFFADPGSIHDQKWIGYFADRDGYEIYIVPRAGQMTKTVRTEFNLNATLLEPIADFSIVRFYRTIRTASRLRRLVKKLQIDIIHILYAEPNALWTLFRFWFGVPVVISSRGTDVLKTIPEAFARRTWIDYLSSLAYRRAFQNASWITSTSAKQKKSIQSFAGPINRFSFIRTGVDSQKLVVDTPVQLLDVTGDFILFPRYMKPLYNHEFSLKAIELLPDSIKNKYTMVFLGREHGEREYQTLVENTMAGITGAKFLFLPKQPQSKLFELYRKASLVVMNPLSDGSPVSAMEALLCGCRLIMGPLEYDKEVFCENVVLLDRWDAAELAEKIVDQLAQGLANPLSKRTTELMNLKYNMAQLEKIYQTLANENRQ
jgi:glycosyltransferase involved in cell wall biosynthesis